MTHRYYHPQITATDELELEGQEAHHLLHVMRARAGEPLRLFDGAGNECLGEIIQTNRATAKIRVIERFTCDRELATQLTIAVALPKGDRQKVLVEKLVELGVHGIIPLSTDRSVVNAKENVAKRLERVVIEASKQCGRNRLLKIADPLSSVQLWRATKPNSLRWLAHPEGGISISEAVPKQLPAQIIVAVGPEGGWTDDELAGAASAGWLRIGLGPRILRIETAALAVAAFWSLTTFPVSAPPSA
jgi:16S rRNA (uracil1498-N3)-methyltransferase